MSTLFDIFRRCRTVSTDSRTIAAGSLFFALRGESFDGNRYAIAALEKGAAYAVVDCLDTVRNQSLGATMSYEQCRDRIVECDDTLTALQLLAAEHRVRLGIPILAITGSNGKTTTKELLSRVLARRYCVATTKGNLNNHIGVPLTLLSMDNSVEFGVVEMGASACGEIALLSAIARPDFGIITNIGRAHLEGFGGEEGVKRGKGELCDFLADHEGVYFYHDQSAALREIADQHPQMSCVPFSASLAAGIRSHLEGDYNRYNIAAAVAIGRYFDIEPELITEAIESYVPDNNRSQRIDGQRNTLIADCYNANPSSVAAAIDNFASIVGVVRDKCVILGDMLELGDYSAAEHEAVIERLMALGICEAYLVGSNFCLALDRLRTQSGVGGDSIRGVSGDFRSFAKREDLEAYLAANPLQERFMLIKGSHSIGLEKLISQM